MDAKRRFSDSEVAARLARRGLRLTRQRKVVFDAVSKADGHPAANEIYETARRVLPQISLGTVYRTLGVLRDAGVVQERLEALRPRVWWAAPSLENEVASSGHRQNRDGQEAG